MIVHIKCSKLIMFQKTKQFAVNYVRTRKNFLVLLDNAF